MLYPSLETCPIPALLSSPYVLLPAQEPLNHLPRWWVLATSLFRFVLHILLRVMPQVSQINLCPLLSVLSTYLKTTSLISLFVGPVS